MENAEDRARGRWHSLDRVERRIKTFLLVPPCLLALCMPASATKPRAAKKLILPQILVAQPPDLPGFRYASREIHASTSPSRYIEKIIEVAPREAGREISFLRRAGFQEGVQELFYGLPGEALSIAEVFSSRRGSRRAFDAAAAEDISPRADPTEKTFKLDAIPGAVGFSGPDFHGPGGFANVLFSTGRCFFLVGNALKAVSDSEQLDAVPDAGALALYRRDKERCR